MRGDDAKEKCSDIVLCMVPTANGKADLTRFDITDILFYKISIKMVE